MTFDEWFDTEYMYQSIAYLLTDDEMVADIARNAARAAWEMAYDLAGQEYAELDAGESLLSNINTGKKAFVRTERSAQKTTFKKEIQECGGRYSGDLGAFDTWFDKAKGCIFKI